MDICFHVQSRWNFRLRNIHFLMDEEEDNQYLEEKSHE